MDEMQRVKLRKPTSSIDPKKATFQQLRRFLGRYGWISVYPNNDGRGYCDPRRGFTAEIAFNYNNSLNKTNKIEAYGKSNKEALERLYYKIVELLWEWCKKLSN